MLKLPGRHGFTLAEVLIALALLGVIAAFSIPKILQSSSDNQKGPIFRETLGTLSQIIHEGYLSNAIRATSDYSYFSTRINTLKACPGDANAQGCWSNAQQGTALNSESIQAGFVLPNGVRITGFNAQMSDDENGVYIDWNGISQPNRLGEDQLYVMMCYRSPCTYIAGQKGGQILPSGTLVGLTAQQAADNQRLFDSIVTP
jgi:prepilin-type N-terminal cleavage/methylation domain-containing protein